MSMKLSQHLGNLGFFRSGCRLHEKTIANSGTVYGSIEVGPRAARHPLTSARNGEGD
jgi:hypothetical protein